MSRDALNFLAQYSTNRAAKDPEFAALPGAAQMVEIMRTMDAQGVSDPDLAAEAKATFDFYGGLATATQLPQAILSKGLTSTALPSTEGHSHVSALNEISKYRDDNSADSVAARFGKDSALALLAPVVSQRAVDAADFEQRKLESGGLVDDVTARFLQGVGTGTVDLLPLSHNVRANATSAINRFIAGDNPERDGKVLSQLAEGAGQLVPQMALAYATAGIGNGATGVAGARLALAEAQAATALGGEALSVARTAELTNNILAAERAGQLIGRGLSTAAFGNQVGGQAYDEVYAKTGDSSKALTAAFGAAPFGFLETLGSERVAAMLRSTPNPGAAGYLKAITTGFLEEGLSTLPTDIGSDVSKSMATGDSSYMKSASEYLTSAAIEGILGGVTGGAGHLVGRIRESGAKKRDDAVDAKRVAANDAVLNEAKAAQAAADQEQSRIAAEQRAQDLEARAAAEAQRQAAMDSAERDRHLAVREEYGIAPHVSAAGFESVGDMLDHNVRAYDETSDTPYARIAREYQTADPARREELKALAPLAVAQAHEDFQAVLVEDAKRLFAPGVVVTPEIAAAQDRFRKAVEIEGDPGMPVFRQVSRTLQAAIETKDAATRKSLAVQAAADVLTNDAATPAAKKAASALAEAPDFNSQKAAAKELNKVIKQGNVGLINVLNEHLAELLAARGGVTTPANSIKVQAKREELAKALENRDAYLQNSPSVKEANAEAAIEAEIARLTELASRQRARSERQRQEAQSPEAAARAEYIESLPAAEQSANAKRLAFLTEQQLRQRERAAKQREEASRNAPAALTDRAPASAAGLVRPMAALERNVAPIPDPLSYLAPAAATAPVVPGTELQYSEARPTVKPYPFAGVVPGAAGGTVTADTLLASVTDVQAPVAPAVEVAPAPAAPAVEVAPPPAVEVAPAPAPVAPVVPAAKMQASRTAERVKIAAAKMRSGKNSNIVVRPATDVAAPDTLAAYDKQAGAAVKSDKLAPEVLADVQAALGGDTDAFARLNKPETKFIARAVRDSVSKGTAKALGFDLAPDPSERFSTPAGAQTGQVDTAGTSVEAPSPEMKEFARRTGVVFVDRIVSGGVSRSAQINTGTGEVKLSAEHIKTVADAESALGHEGFHAVLTANPDLQNAILSALAEIPEADMAALQSALNGAYRNGELNEELAVVGAQRVFEANKNLQTIFGRFVARIKALFKSAFGRDISSDVARIHVAEMFARGVRAGRSQETRATGTAVSRFSVADINKLAESTGRPILSVFAQTFGQHIKQGTKSIEDVRAVAQDFLTDVRANPERYIAKPKGYTADMYLRMGDGKTYDPNNYDHAVSASDLTRRVYELKGQQLEELLRDEENKTWDERVKAIESVTDYFKGNDAYTPEDAALAVAVATKYSYEVRDGVVQVSEIAANNRVLVPVIGGDVAAFVTELRKGSKLKTAFKDGVDALIAANKVANANLRGWVKHDQSQSEEDVALLMQHAAGTPWCTKFEGNARDQLGGGDFYTYHDESGQAIVAIKTVDGVANEIRGSEKNQNLKPNELEIARAFIEKTPELKAEAFLRDKETENLLRTGSDEDLYELLVRTGSMKVVREFRGAVGYGADPAFPEVVQKRMREAMDRVLPGKRALGKVWDDMSAVVPEDGIVDIALDGNNKFKGAALRVKRVGRGASVNNASTGTLYVDRVVYGGGVDNTSSGKVVIDVMTGGGVDNTSAGTFVINTVSGGHVFNSSKGTIKIGDVTHGTDSSVGIVNKSKGTIEVDAVGGDFGGFSTSLDNESKGTLAVISVRGAAVRNKSSGKVTVGTALYGANVSNWSTGTITVDAVSGGDVNNESTGAAVLGVVSGDSRVDNRSTGTVTIGTLSSSSYVANRSNGAVDVGTISSGGVYNKSAGVVSVVTSTGGTLVNEMHGEIKIGTVSGGATVNKGAGTLTIKNDKRFATAPTQGNLGPDTLGNVVPPATPTLANLVKKTRAAFVDDIVVNGSRKDAFVDVQTGRIYLNATSVTTEAQALSRMGHEGLHLIMSRDASLMAEAVGLLERLDPAMVSRLRDELSAGYDEGVLDEEIAVSAAEEIFGSDRKLQTAFGRLIERIIAKIKQLFGVDVSRDFARIQAAGLFAKGLQLSFKTDAATGDGGFRFATAKDTLKKFTSEAPRGITEPQIAATNLAQVLDRYVFRKDLTGIIGDVRATQEREATNELLDRYQRGEVTAETVVQMLSDQTRRLTGAIYDHYFPNGGPAGLIEQRLRTVPAALRTETDKLTAKTRAAVVTDARSKLTERYVKVSSKLAVNGALHPDVATAVRAAYPIKDEALLGGKISAAEKDLQDVVTLLQGEDQIVLLGDADFKDVVESLEQFEQTLQLPKVGKALARAWAIRKLNAGQVLGRFNDAARRFTKSFLNWATDSTAIATALAANKPQLDWIRSIDQRFYDAIGNQYNRSFNRFLERVHASVVKHFKHPVVSGETSLRMSIASMLRQNDRGTIDADGDLAVNVDKLKQSWENAIRAGVNGRRTGEDVKAKQAMLADLLTGIDVGAPGSMESLRKKVETWLTPNEFGFLTEMVELFAELEPHSRHALESNTNSTFRPVNFYIPLLAFNGTPSTRGSGGDGPLFGLSSGAFAQAVAGVEEIPPEMATSLMDRKRGLSEGTVYYSDSVTQAIVSAGKHVLADIHLGRMRNEIMALTDRSNIEGQASPISTQLEAVLGQQNGAGGAVIVAELRRRLIDATSSTTVSARSLIPGEEVLVALQSMQSTIALSSLKHMVAQPAQAFVSYMAKHANDARGSIERLAKAVRMQSAPGDTVSGAFKDKMFSGPFYQIAHRVVSREGTVSSSSYVDRYGAGIKIGDKVRAWVKSFIGLAPGVTPEFADKLLGHIATINEFKDKALGFALRRGDGYSAETVALAELSYQWERNNPGRIFDFENPPVTEERDHLATSAALNTIIGPSDQATKGQFFQDTRPGVRIFRNLVSVFPTFNGTAASHGRQAVYNMMDRHKALGGSFAETVKDADFQEHLRTFMAGLSGNLAFVSAGAGFTLLLRGAIAAMRGDDDNEEALLAAYAKRNKLRAQGNEKGAAAMHDAIAALEARDVPTQRLAQAASGEAFMVKIGQSLISSVFILPALSGGVGDVVGHILVDGPRSALFKQNVEEHKEELDARIAKAKKAGAHYALAEAQLEARRLDRVKMVEIGHTEGSLGDGKTLFGSGTLSMGYTRIANALEPFWFDDPDKETPLTPLAMFNALSAAGFGQADATTIINAFAATYRADARAEETAAKRNEKK